MRFPPTREIEDSTEVNDGFKKKAVKRIHKSIY